VYSSNLYTTAGRSENLRWTSKVSVLPSEYLERCPQDVFAPTNTRFRPKDWDPAYSGSYSLVLGSCTPKGSGCTPVEGLKRSAGWYVRFAGEVTPILIGVESVAYRTRYSVHPSYLFLR
jgi:hypothetical protein